MIGSETIKETLHKTDCVRLVTEEIKLSLCYQAARAVWSIQENGGKSCEKTVF